MLESVVTIIAAPGSRIPEEAIAASRRALSGLGAEVGRAEWLAAGEVCELPFNGLAPEQAEAAACQQLAGAPLDVVAQPVQGRRKRLLLADMESTIIRNEMLDELADFLGVRPEVAEITRQAMNGEIDFVAALEARVALLKGRPVGLLEQAGKRIEVMPGAAALVATMKAHGATTALVSGGFRFYTRRIRAALGFDFDIANDLAIEGGLLSGRVTPPIVTRETKLATLTRLAAERNLPLAATLAVGDGANDLPMIEAAGLGVAFRAKPAVAARARVSIEHGDLTALLYLQGYRASEIVWP